MLLSFYSALSCGSVYIKGPLALFHLDLIDHVSKCLDFNDFILLSGPDVFKTLVLVSCYFFISDAQNNMVSLLLSIIICTLYHTKSTLRR